MTIEAGIALLQRARFFSTAGHPCPYLAGNPAQNIVLDPAFEVTPLVYQTLIDFGFRRSGSHLYRPGCPTCSACVPVRVPVSAFAPDRSQRRCWKALQPKLSVSVEDGQELANYHQLFRRYIRSRHPGGSMSDSIEDDDSADFLLSRWAETKLYVFRLGEAVQAVAATDRLPNGLSAVYTFFEPDSELSGLGTYSVLWQIERARTLGLPYVYLGYWIRDCRKMSYKDRFRPLEVWRGQRWVRHARNEDVPPTSR